MLTLATHTLSALIVIGWFCVLYAYRIPRWKFEHDRLGVDFSPSAIRLVVLFNVIVSYWYVLVLLSPVALICDFWLTGLIAKQIGLRWVCLSAACIAILLLANIAVWEYIAEHQRLLLHAHKL